MQPRFNSGLMFEGVRIYLRFMCVCVNKSSFNEFFIFRVRARARVN